MVVTTRDDCISRRKTQLQFLNQFRKNGVFLNKLFVDLRNMVHALKVRISMCLSTKQQEFTKGGRVEAERENWLLTVNNRKDYTCDKPLARMSITGCYLLTFKRWVRASPMHDSIE